MTKTPAAKKPATMPVWFVNPETGDAIELDLRTATFSKRS